jgi:hypothetical protein
MGVGLGAGLRYPGAYVALDFKRNIYELAGRKRSSSIVSITRATVGSAEDSAGTPQTFTSGQLRRTDKGLLVEDSRANLLLSSATLSTQSATVTNVAHTLSFYGTGTVTLSGASTAGPLVGVGSTRVSLTFTPSAGTLTLTVSGSVTFANLEIGSAASSWIPTTGAPVTRNADDVTLTGLSVPDGCTLVVEGRASSFVSTDARCSLSDGSTANRMVLIYNGTNINLQDVVSGSSPWSPTFAVSPGAAFKAAIAAAGSSPRGAVNGTTASTFAGSANTTLTQLDIGKNAGSSLRYWNGFIERILVFKYAMSDAQLASITA